MTIEAESVDHMHAITITKLCEIGQLQVLYKYKYHMPFFHEKHNYSRCTNVLTRNLKATEIVLQYQEKIQKI